MQEGSYDTLVEHIYSTTRMYEKGKKERGYVEVDSE